MDQELNHLPGLTPRKVPSGGVLSTVVEIIRRPLVATVLALSSATAVGLGAYPEKRAELHEGVEEAVDRLFFTVATLTTTSTDIMPTSTREKLCWIIGVIGLWGTGAVALTGLLQKAKELADKLEKEIPMAETKYVVDCDAVNGEQLAQLLSIHGFTCRELTTLHFRERDDGIETKMQCVGDSNAPSEVKLRTKIAFGDDGEGDNYINTHVFDSTAFGKALFDQWSAEPSTVRSHKFRWSLRGRGGRDVHVDFYTHDTGTSMSLVSHGTIVIEVVQQSSDTVDPLTLIPDFLRHRLKGKIDKKDRHIAVISYERLCGFLLEDTGPETDEA